MFAKPQVHSAGRKDTSKQFPIHLLEKPSSSPYVMQCKTPPVHLTSNNIRDSRQPKATVVGGSVDEGREAGPRQRWPLLKTALCAYGGKYFPRGIESVSQPRELGRLGTARASLQQLAVPQKSRPATRQQKCESEKAQDGESPCNQQLFYGYDWGPGKGKASTASEIQKGGTEPRSRVRRVSGQPFSQVKTPTISKLSINPPKHLHPSIHPPSAF